LDEVLQSNYGLDSDRTMRLVNQGATLAEIERGIRAFGPGGSMELSEDDQLVISFAGHGEEDPLTHETSFVPYDGHIDSPSTWFRFDHLRSILRVIRAKHVLVISDSCFSGGVFRNASTQIPDEIGETYAQRAYASKSRLMISSGGKEIVTDSGGGHGGSVFIEGILNSIAKRSNHWVLAEEIFRDARKFVVENSQQTPEFGGLERSGHDGGQIVLFRKNASSTTNKPATRPNTPPSSRGYSNATKSASSPSGGVGANPEAATPWISSKSWLVGMSVGLCALAIAAWTVSTNTFGQSAAGNNTSVYDLSAARLDVGPITLKNFSLPYQPPLTLVAGHEFDFQFTIETIDLEQEGGTIALFLDPVADNAACDFGRYTAAIESNMDQRITFGIGNMRGCSSSEILGVDISFETDTGDVLNALSLRFENYITNNQ